jgi:hypothetical protein
MSTQPPNAGDTIHVGKQWLRLQLDKGANCPLCGQLAKMYRRKINAGMAHALIEMYRHGRADWFYLPDITKRWQGRDEAGLRYWGLIEEASTPRPDGGRAGWWRVTDKGIAFVRWNLKVPKYVLVYDGRVFGFDGPDVDIKDALGTKFDYHDLMNGV